MINRRSIKLWLISLAAYLTYFIAIYLIFLAARINIGFMASGMVFSIIGLLLLLPISIAGFGTREICLVFFLGIYNIPSEQAIIASLAQFMIFFLGCGIVGIIPLIMSKIDFKSIKNDLALLKKEI